MKSSHGQCVRYRLGITRCLWNKQFFDTTYTFNYAMVKLPDGTIKGKVATWDDYEGEQLQIKFEDGTTVLVNSTNAVLSVDPINNQNRLCCCDTDGFIWILVYQQVSCSLAKNNKALLIHNSCNI